jgi:hypothetical protein
MYIETFPSVGEVTSRVVEHLDGRYCTCLLNAISQLEPQLAT